MHEHNRHDDRATIAAALLAIAIALFLIALMPATMLWDRDETLYARTAIEMMRSGNFLLPTFNGEVFAHKPPMVYWLMALGFALFGENELGARFVSAPFMAGSAFVTFLIGRRLHSARAGLWAMAALTTTTLTVFVGSAAMLDATLLFFVCLSIYAYVEIVYAPQRANAMTALFFVALLASIFVKGPVGPAVVCTTLLVSWLAMEPGRRPSFGRMVALAALSVLAFLVFLAWLVPADTRSGGEMMRTGIGYHIVERALTPLEGHGGGRTLGWLGTLPYYIPVVLIGFFPWVLYLPAALVGLVRGTLATRRERAILLGWMVPTFVMFSLAATKLPHYLLPAFPAFALAVGIQIVRTIEAGTLSRALRAGLVYYALGAIAFAALVAASPFLLPAGPSPIAALALAIAVVAATGLVVRLFRRADLVGANRALAIATPALFAALLWTVVPAVEPAIKISRPLAELIQTHRGPQTRVVTLGYFEPSIVFYASQPIDRPILPLPEGQDGIARLAALEEEVLVVATREQLEGAAALAGERGFEEIARVSAINTNRGGRVEEVILARRPAAPAAALSATGG
ncbi:ArnT family glycosyltransferase [Salinarimonas sp.]|uniref:ArnT family glycosyltransferase n=1 Tax=Salinarimonas sp. TaxID=2766526 RepID=UPI0039194F68